jgi:hypothetical protein
MPELPQAEEEAGRCAVAVEDVWCAVEEVWARAGVARARRASAGVSFMMQPW